jgi:hypothetical protein
VRGDLADAGPRQRAADFVWSDEANEMLKEKYALGISVTRIAREMGCSRDGVAMQVYRLKLPTPALPAPVEKPVEEPKIRIGSMTTLPPIPGVSDLPVTAQPVFPRRRGCEFPLWPHGARPDHRSCDAPRLFGQPYCAKHQAICTNGRGSVIKWPVNA